jgi:5-dehydro-4-deoxyglucarate dehydratase
MPSFERIRKALRDGLLSFPVTDFAADGGFDPVGYRARIERFATQGVSAVFVAGGTGEFFSLSCDEYQEIVQIAVDAVANRVPVIASAGRSVADACRHVAAAQAAGIDGILLMPPYLTGCPGDGLVQYASAVMISTDLPVIYYNRANGILRAPELQVLADQMPNFIGLKDGVGDIAMLNDTIKTLGDRLAYVGGVPTAEMFAEAYLAIGVNTYSSAVFNFIPDLALRFYAALRGGDSAYVQDTIRRFFVPFCRLRDRKPGYAVSLIKAGAALQGLSAGDVRPPLVMPTAAEVAELREIIDSLTGDA